MGALQPCQLMAELLQGGRRVPRILLGGRGGAERAGGRRGAEREPSAGVAPDGIQVALRLQAQGAQAVEPLGRLAQRGRHPLGSTGGVSGGVSELGLRPNATLKASNRGAGSKRRELHRLKPRVAAALRVPCCEPAADRASRPRPRCHQPSDRSAAHLVRLEQCKPKPSAMQTAKLNSFVGLKATGKQSVRPRTLSVRPMAPARAGRQQAVVEAKKVRPPMLTQAAAGGGGQALPVAPSGARRRCSSCQGRVFAPPRRPAPQPPGGGRRAGRGPEPNPTEGRGAPPAHALL